MADDPLRAALESRIAQIREKIAGRKNKSGSAENVELMQSTLNELERVLAATPPDEGDE